MLQLNELVVGYDKPLIGPITKDFNGNITGILAQSGKGKTTLFKTLCGVIPPISGSFTADAPVAMMCQRNTNFDWLTCLDNVLICDKINHRKPAPTQALEMLAAVGLMAHRDDFPRALSGGEQQRLSLARILYLKPEILLMDEPLSALDEQTRAAMQSLVLRQHKALHNTILFVTHSQAEAKLMCNTILNF
nr:MAG TPA: transporter [Caudoviricetes sp.]